MDEMAGNALINFRSTLTSLDLQFTNICTELNRVNRENVDLKRQVERLEGRVNFRIFLNKKFSSLNWKSRCFII